MVIPEVSRMFWSFKWFFMRSLVILDILGVFGIFNEYFLNFDHFGGLLVILNGSRVFFF